MPRKIAGHYGREFASRSFGKFHRLATALQEDIDMFLLASRQGVRAVPSFIEYKNAHLHTQLIEQVAYFVLLVGRAAGASVVFPAPESLVVSKLDLVQDVASGVVGKLSVMRAIFQLKWLPALSGLRLALSGKCPQMRTAHYRAGSQYGLLDELSSFHCFVRLNV